jgi:hypothetical protein
MSKWPKDTLQEKIAFYGDPRGGNGQVNQKWYAANIIRVTPPFKMYYAGKPVSGIAFHKKCKDALSAALEEIWEKCDKRQSTIDSHGLSLYGGSFNYRPIRGSRNISNHSFGIAIDIDPSNNPLGAMHGDMPDFAVQAFKRQGARWGGDYKSRKDWMHYEFVS